MKLFNKLLKLFPYTLVLILALTPIIWFYGKGNVLINGIDTNFPLDPLVWFTRRLFVWTDFPNTGADFSSSTAGIFFHLIQVIPYILGLSLQNVQLISLIFWFGLIVFSAYIFAKVIFKQSFLVQILFVVLYSFNPYLFNTWENVKVSNLALIAALPLGLAIFLALNSRSITRAKAAFFSALVGIVLSGSGINPSYFLTFYFILFIFLISLFLVHWWQKSILSYVLNFLIICAVILAVNLFWILPTANFTLNNISPSGSIYKLGLTNWLDNLSENTSIFNVTRLQGAWDWYTIDDKTKLPLYIPYALNYFYRLPFIIFSILIPALALLSFLFIKKEQYYLYIALGIMTAIGIFLTAGTHLPSGVFYRFLVDHLPFFTIFRSPWYIFSPLITLSFAGLVSLLFYNLYQIIEKNNLKIGRLLFLLSIGILIFGNFLYNYPLVSGKIFRPGQKDSFFVEFPEYIFDARNWLKNQREGRILNYPDDEIENFEWGYRGIESIIGLFSEKELIYSPLSFFDPKPVSLVVELYNSLKKGQMDDFWALAAKLNIGIIFEKKDQRSLSPEMTDKLGHLEKVNFGQWNFYQVPSDFYQPKIYPAKRLVFGYPIQQGTQLLTVLGKEDVLVDSKDSVVARIQGIAETAGEAVLANNSQLSQLNDFLLSKPVLAIRLTSRDLSTVEFSFNIKEEGKFEPGLEKYRLSDYGIDTSKGLEVTVDGKKELWQVKNETDSYVFLNPVNFSAGTHQIILELDNKNLMPGGGNFEGELSYTQTGEAIFEILQDERGKYLSIFNRKTSPPDPSADFSLPVFDPLSTYLIQLYYKQIYGNIGQVVVLQGNKDTLVKAQAEGLPSYPQWNLFSFYFRPVITPSQLKIAFVAPFTEDPLGTKIFYDDIRLQKVFTNKLVFLNRSEKPFLVSPKLDFKKNSPTSYEVNIEGAEGPHVLVFSENYSPDWELKVTGPAGEKLDINPLHFSANIYANAWYLNNTPSSYKAKIFYKPQRLFWVGFGVSIITIIFLGFLAYFSSIKKLLKRIV